MKVAYLRLRNRTLNRFKEQKQQIVAAKPIHKKKVLRVVPLKSFLLKSILKNPIKNASTGASTPQKPGSPTRNGLSCLA